MGQHRKGGKKAGSFQAQQNVIAKERAELIAIKSKEALRISKLSVEEQFTERLKVSGLNRKNFQKLEVAKSKGVATPQFINRLKLEEQGKSIKEISEIFEKEAENRKITLKISKGITKGDRRSITQNIVLPTVSKFIVPFTKPTKKLTVSQERLQGFQGDTGLVGKPLVSKFDIVGDKAVSKGSQKSGFAFTKGIPTGNKEIDRIFAQQRGVTQLIASEFKKKRNIALAGGESIDEANQFAKVTSKGLPKAEQEAINIVLQKDIIQTRASQLDLAETLIKKQVSGEIPAGGLDDLAEQLKFAQPIPIKIIRVGLDSEGRDISPRKTKLQIENAILTGSKLSDLDFSVQVDKTLKLSSKSSDDIFTTDTFGNIIIDNIKFSEIINPVAIKQIESGDNDIFDFILKDLAESKVSPELISQARFDGLTLTKQQIQDITIEGEILKDTEILQGTQNKLIELIQSGNIDAISNDETGLISLITKSGEQIFQGTPEQVINFIDKQLEESGIQNEQLLAIISDLRAQLRGGDNLSEILSALFSIFAELQRLGLQQEGQQKTLEEITEVDPLKDFFDFFGNIYLGLVTLFTGSIKQ